MSLLIVDKKQKNGSFSETNLDIRATEPLGDSPAEEEPSDSPEEKGKHGVIRGALVTPCQHVKKLSRHFVEPDLCLTKQQLSSQL